MYWHRIGMVWYWYAIGVGLLCGIGLVLIWRRYGDGIGMVLV